MGKYVILKFLIDLYNYIQIIYPSLYSLKLNFNL